MTQLLGIVLVVASIATVALPPPQALPEIVLRAGWLGFGLALAWRLWARRSGYVHVAPRGAFHLWVPQAICLNPGQNEVIERAPAGVSDLAPVLLFFVASAPFVLIYMPSAAETEPSDVNTLWAPTAVAWLTLFALVIPSVLRSRQSARLLARAGRSDAIEGTLLDRFSHTVQVVASGRGTGTRRTRWADLRIQQPSSDTVRVEGTGARGLTLSNTNWMSGRQSVSTSRGREQTYQRFAGIGDQILVLGATRMSGTAICGAEAFLILTLAPGLDPRSWIRGTLLRARAIWAAPATAAVYCVLLAS